MQLKLVLILSTIGLSAVSAYVAPIPLAERSTIKAPEEWADEMNWFSRSCISGGMGTWYKDGGTQGACVIPPQGAAAVNLNRIASGCQMHVFSDSSCTQNATTVTPGGCVEMASGLGGFIIDGTCAFA